MTTFCKWIGHKWRYNFTTIPNKRICEKCKCRQQIDFEKMKWVNGFKNKDIRSDSELISRWPSLVKVEIPNLNNN